MGWWSCLILGVLGWLCEDDEMCLVQYHTTTRARWLQIYRRVKQDLTACPTKVAPWSEETLDLVMKRVPIGHAGSACWLRLRCFYSFLQLHPKAHARVCRCIRRGKVSGLRERLWPKIWLQTRVRPAGFPDMPFKQFWIN